MLRGFVVALAVFLLADCSAGMAGTVTIPTFPSPSPGVQVLCPASLYTPFTLEGDPAASPPVWGVDRFGRRFDIIWPPGFRARFTPKLEILDPSGAVVARAGTVSDAGGAGDDNTRGICSIGGKVYF